MTLNSASIAGLRRRLVGGILPRIGVSALLCAPAALPILSGACSNGSADQVTKPLPVGMTSAIAPYYNDGNLTIYQANRPAPLPVRHPTPQESSALGPAPSGTPYPRAPFLKAQDESIEVHYTVSNLDATSHTVWVLIDPWNEFVRYVPGVTVVDDDVTVPNLGYDLSFQVDGMSRLQGTVTSDDMQEIARKLAAAENVIKNSATITMLNMTEPNAPSVSDLVNHIFNPQNRSNTGDPLYTPYIPPVVAGVTGFDLGIRTFEPANVAVEITMDIVDVNGNRFVAADSTDKQIGLPPAELTLSSARF